MVDHRHCHGWQFDCPVSVFHSLLLCLPEVWVGSGLRLHPLIARTPLAFLNVGILVIQICRHGAILECEIPDVQPIRPVYDMKFSNSPGANINHTQIDGKYLLRLLPP